MNRVRQAGVALLLTVFAGCAIIPEWVLHQAPGRGDDFPPVKLQAGHLGDERQYLGVDGREVVTLDEIEADAVVVFLFDMYCRYCQDAGPQAVEVYKRLKDRQDVKVIGIALTNSLYEVELYKSKFNIPFPMFPDPDASNRALMGRVGTPAFYTVYTQGDSRGIIYLHSGAFLSDDETPETFVTASLKRLAEENSY